MTPNFVRVLILTALFTSFASASDDDENFYFANNNNKFLFNTRQNCQPNYYFDVDYFRCRLCDPNFNLMATEQKHKCMCDNNSTEVFVYDNILRRPICEKGGGKLNATKCSMRFVNATRFSSVRKSVRIFRDEKCLCDEKGNENYRGEYCIKNELFKDLKNYQYYKNLPLTQTLNLSQELKYIIFFCKVLHQRNYCNYLANLCVLTHYDLDKNGPCFPFYKQQNQQNGISVDDNASEGSEFDGGEKLKPFLFFKTQKSTKALIEKSIDFSYGVANVNNTVNFTIVSYDLRGNLIEMRPFKLSDLDLCNAHSAPVNLYQPNVKFARDFFSKCTINLRDFIDHQPDTKFSSIHLNYYESQANFLETVPILIRNAFEVNNFDDIERWQLVKRFFLVDTITGRVASPGKNVADGDKAKFYDQFSQINYVKSIELRFLMKDDDEDSDEINRINIPLLVMEYATVNLTQLSSRSDDSQFNVDFSFKIKFVKRPNLKFFFQINLPISLSLSFLYALLQTFFFKVRQQKLEYDLSVLLNFVINLLANISNAFFVFILMFVGYIFMLYKSQDEHIRVLLPLEKEEKTIGVFFAFALIFKIVKLLKIFYDMTTFDIFFIDFERPKYHNSDHFFQGSNKSHPGTPSITSSFKPTISSPSPTNECVSAWRNYFIANEWQELMTKRKISIHLHIVFVIGALMLLGVENFASSEFSLHFNQTRMQNYLGLYRAESDAQDIVNSNIFLKVAVGATVYLVFYLFQRIFNFLIYERFVDNSLQQFIDVSSIANISVLILINSYGFYIHGRSVHGRSDTDAFNMILQLKREEENLCGHRGLLPGSDQQTYTILAPRNLRLFYEKLINPLTSKTSHNHHPFNNQSVKLDHNFEKMILTYHNINRFFAAFIDHALKDVDYVVKEKNLFEKLFDCEMHSNINDAKGVFYFDGHSFDKVLFYGNENSIFSFEYLLFTFLLFTSGSFLMAILSIGVICKLKIVVINHLTKNNLARKTLIDKRFLI